MPKTEVVYYAESSGKAPALDWILAQPADVQDKLFARVLRLEAEGHALRRPEAAPLRDGIYELRVRHGKVNYRLLYGFHRRRGVIALGCTKEAKVDEADIDRAVTRMTTYAKDPQRHTFTMPDGD